MGDGQHTLSSSRHPLPTQAGQCSLHPFHYPPLPLPLTTAIDMRILRPKCSRRPFSSIPMGRQSPPVPEWISTTGGRKTGLTIGEQFIRQHRPRYGISALITSGSGSLSNFLFDCIASWKFSVPWLHWPAQLSLFHPASGSRSNGFLEQLNGPTKTDGGRIPPYSDPNPGHSPPGPPEPMDHVREERQNVDEIHRLIQSPVLYNPLRAPRYPIVLCHGAPPETTT